MFGVNLDYFIEAKIITLLYTGGSAISHNVIFPLLHVVVLLRGRRGAKFHCLISNGGKKQVFHTSPGKTVCVVSPCR